MCTAILLCGVGPDHPVVVAANRDEFRARPAAGPVQLLDKPRAIGGLDLARGGSWLGVTEAGFLALLTNQPEPGGPRPAARSRGEIVLEVLRRGHPAGARAYLAELDGAAYNSFNLLYGDAAGLEVAYGRAERRQLECQPVPPGLHILPNGRLDDPSLPKVARARSLVDPHLGAPWPDLSRQLAIALADHDAVCIHTPDYGTRSAAIIALDPGRLAHLLWAPGPPCTTPFTPADV